MRLSDSNGKDAVHLKMVVSDVKKYKNTRIEFRILKFLKALFALPNGWVGFYVRLLLPKLLPVL